MSSNPIFIPVQGSELQISKTEELEGRLYFATDSGKMYLDTNKGRIKVGGSGDGSSTGVGIHYGNAKKPVKNGELYSILKTEVQESFPALGDLILNSDGGFYKVKEITEEGYLCSLLTVSGTGGSGGVSKTKPTIKFEINRTNLINGQRAYFTVSGQSALEADGVTPIDVDFEIVFSLGTKIGDIVNNYYTKSIPVEKTDGSFTKEVEFGSYLQDSANSVLSVYIRGNNHDEYSSVRTAEVTTSQLKLSHISGYTPSNIYSVDGFTISCNIVGSIDKIVKFYYDEKLIETRKLGYNTPNSNPGFVIPAGAYDSNTKEPISGTATHGHHKIRFELYQDLGDGVEGIAVEPLEYEIAVVGKDASLPPVIWLGNYKKVYYTYDSIRIPFLVYDPANTDFALVHLYKDKIELEGSPREIHDLSGYTYWEITDATFNQQNAYQISCGETEDRYVEREISFTIEEDSNRTDFKIDTSDLKLNFDATGRSNSESKTKRASWSYELNGQQKNAQFTNFNWYNNGWTTDKETNSTCLRISNGAQLSIPYDTMIFANNIVGQQSHTIEMQFRIRNIQNYDNLIKNITRYQFGEEENAPNDETEYKAFKAQRYEEGGYDNYDAYLQAVLPPDKYELLVIRGVEKEIQIDNIVAGLYDYNNNNVVGVCVGTQDAFFSNGSDTVNVNFVENDLINLSFVYQHSLKQLYIYINGCITGVIKSSIEEGNTFSITNSNFIFKSDHCDIDLYKLRIYATDLNVNTIIKNFAVDRKNIDIFDQSVLAQQNDILNEYQLSFENMLKYNDDHPDNPLMPYIVFDTGNMSSKLPYSKEDDKKIQVEFVNVPLEQAYLNGKLAKKALEDGLYLEGAGDKVIAEAIKTYYKHHCPSFVTYIKANDMINFEVQGTSSEFYPRRNYKIKTKAKGSFNWKDNEDLPEDEQTEDGGKYTETEALNIFMNRGPFAQDYQNDKIKVATDPRYIGYETTRLTDGWYMNNYTNATDRWTMKVDYMESSGSYNAGFASMVGNSYTKHPLKDYWNVLNGTNNLKPVVSQVNTGDNGMRWEDFRTSLLGFPVMAFWKRNDGENDHYIFIGYYRMLLDKSSTQVLGFKTPSGVTHKLFPDGVKDGKQQYKKLKDIAECWEFSNNARGYCSYRDPWKRVELSFTPPAGVANEYTSKGAPIVANSFEYRYHPKDDYIDILYNFDQATQAQLNEVAKKLNLPENSIIEKDKVSGTRALLSTHKNWEKVCKWLWSTDVDAVISQGGYTVVPVGDREYLTDGTFFIIDDSNDFVPSYDEFDPNKTYYVENPTTNEEEKEKKPYIEVNAAPKEYLYEIGKFYYQVAGQKTEDVEDDIYALSYDGFDGSIKYYEFNEHDPSTYDIHFDLLVRPVNIETEEYNSETQYYTWHGTDYDANDKSKQVVVSKGNATGAVRKVESSNASDWAAGKYYVANPTTYAGKTFTHDTREYRIAKFTNEFERHFDPEYVATYFVMTEVLECYDSRGKNCMMASWGPKEEWLTDSQGAFILDNDGNKIPGEYIWYPIFYDIDTQLGINNTGIPSFEYNVDASEAGNYSTSDSILWNNFYKFFKNTWMLPKYQNLRNIDTDKFEKLYDVDGRTSKAPLQSVDYIEKWYTFDPETYHNIACSGVKPLIATNLDLFFKYITITNKEAKSQDVAKLDRNGEYAIDPGTYFYALQGDRSQSRRQFVTNRLEYIDSWLTQGNYARAGTNCVWGRISANNRSDLNSEIADTHSDKWTETTTDRYWVNDVEFGQKTHEFDAEYWLEPKPIRSAYVTAGDDSANYPSQKYDGVHDLKFKLNELENGIRTSNNYPEQLLYVYGLNQMSDLGDLSKMYWTEFKIEGDASRLTRLKLGHDGTTIDKKSGSSSEVSEIKWYNNKINSITWENSLPLLKEANFSNITITGDVKSMDLSGSEKLRNFRATGSNITSINFADGVALDTLYYPATTTNLSLVQANLLTDLILPKLSQEAPELPQGQKYYTTPKLDPATNMLKAEKGLYLEGFFDDTASCALNNIKIDGGNLGYNSYTILKRLWDKNNGKGYARVTFKNVDWCPYTQLTEGAEYDATKAYYKDNGHYGFDRYNGPTQVLAGVAFEASKKYYTKNEDGEFILYTGGADGFNDAVASGLYVEYIYDKIQFNADILSGILYVDNGHGGRTNDGAFGSLVTDLNDSTITLLQTLYNNRDNFVNSSGQGHAEISGYIYIDNTTPITEAEILTLQSYYPQAIFFFKNVTKAYSARFVYFNEEDYSEKYVKWANGSSSPSVQKIQSYSENVYFNNPFDKTTGYKPEKTHYDFVGWSLNNKHPYDAEGNLLSSVILDGDLEAWNKQKLTEKLYDYTYYAIFKLHAYEIRCYNNNDSNYGEHIDTETNQKYHSIRIEYGQPLDVSSIVMPQASITTDVERRNAFRGWTMNKENGRIYEATENVNEFIVDLSKYSVIKDFKLYAIFQEESVYDSITDDKYFYYTYGVNGYPIINLKPELGNALSGKITLPAKDPKGNYIKGIGLMFSYYTNENTSSPPTFASKNGAVNGKNITHIFFEKGSQYERIEKYAFMGTDTNGNNYHAIEGIYLPDTINYIGNYAFAYLYRPVTISGITTMPVNNNITVIGARAFSGGYGSAFNQIDVIGLPENLTELGANTFYNNTAAHFNKIPLGLKELQESTFERATRIVINSFGLDARSQLTSIGDSCFKGVNSPDDHIPILYFGAKVTHLGKDAFALRDVESVYTPLKENEVDWSDRKAAIFGDENVIINYESEVI